jgi:predicted nucleotidyltransferase
MVQGSGDFRLEEVLGARVLWRVLRVLLERPFLSFPLTRLAEALHTSRASVLRSIRRLEEASLVITTDGKLYRANTEQPMVHQLWSLFMLERARNMQPEFKNTIDLFFRVVEEQVEVFIVFGSVARGLATPRSDIDVCVIGEGAAEKRFDFLPYRFEVHTYDKDGFTALEDLVILDALLNGIVLKGQAFVFHILKDLRSFPKAYLLYRLNRAKYFRQRASELEGEAEVYYTSLADLALREVETVLKQGTPVSKAELEGPVDIGTLERELARRGDRIWLTLI